MKTTLVAASLLSALPYVAAHGYLRQIAIAGKIYRGNIPDVSNFPSPIRAIDDITPVKGATNRALNCGKNAKIAALVADANPGDELTFDWAGGDNGNWPHDTGPMLTYLASCGNTTCDKFDAINAEWFKIDEVGQKPNSAKWFQQDIMAGDTYSTHLPSNLAAGDYLVRHEIIGLHIANVVGGAEFYPSCTQIRVGGNETGQPNSISTVSLPGAYVDNSPSLVGDFFDPINYTFPGPTIDPELASGGVAITDPAPKTDGQPDPTASATTSASQATQTTDDTDDGDDDDDCEDDDGDDDDNETSVSASATATDSSTTASATVTSSSASVSASATATASANNAAVSSTTDGYSYRPRQVSRIMRRLYPQL